MSEPTVGVSQINEQDFSQNLVKIADVFGKFLKEASDVRKDGSHVKSSLKRAREFSLELRELLKEHKKLSILVSNQ